MARSRTNDITQTATKTSRFSFEISTNRFEAEKTRGNQGLEQGEGRDRPISGPSRRSDPATQFSFENVL